MGIIQTLLTDLLQTFIANQNSNNNFLNSGIGNYQAAVTVSGVTTLTAAQFGSFVKLTGTAPYTVIIPTPVGNGRFSFEFWNNTSGTVTLSTPAGQFTGFGFTAASTYAIAAGQYINIISDGANWFTSDNSKLSQSGTFSPTVVEGAGTVTYTLQKGKYVQIGSYVHLDIDVTGSISGGSGILSISIPSNLVPSTDFLRVGTLVLIASSMGTSQISPFAVIASGGTAYVMPCYIQNGSAYNVSGITGTFDFRISISYVL